MSDSDPPPHFYFFLKQITPNYFIAIFPPCKPSTLAGALRNSGGMREVG